VTLSIERDVSGGLICTLGDGEREVCVTAAAAREAAHDLRATLQEAEAGDLAECRWPVPGGEYRWMLRPGDGRITVVVLFSAGVVPGWQHVFREECDAAWLGDSVRAQLDALGFGGGR
jgi:hypothetical protein